MVAQEQREQRRARRQDLAQTNTWRARRIRFMHRVHARRVARKDISTRFVVPPEPRTIGIVGRGKQLIAGKFLFSGLLIEGPRRSIWHIVTENASVIDEIQGCGWLDDLAAVGDEAARERAQTWVFDWIAQQGNGTGPGWTPGTTGRRVIRWINHAALLLRGQDKAATDLFFQSLAQQTLFLAKRWKVMPSGLQRLEAFTGTIYAGLLLEGMAGHVPQAVEALGKDCLTLVDADGAIGTRNPEDLLETLSLLNTVAVSLAQTGHKVPAPIMDAIERITPTLRALRHADGGLARFHGGGRGVVGRLDEALAASGVKTLPAAGLRMGYGRLAGGRTSVIADAAAPPAGHASANAHASTLGFELTSGRRPVIVNCGSGARFGADWRRASRATPSHTTLGIDGVSSSHLGPRGRLTSEDELLTGAPSLVRANFLTDGSGRKLELSHNGYQPTHGLTHARILNLSVDGRTLEGEDLLTTLDPPDKATFDTASAQAGPDGIAYSIRFHLHPDVVTAIDAAATVVSLTLKSGEIWVFRFDGEAALHISGSVYLENGRLRPRATQQVVLSGRTMAYATRVRWSLAKAQGTPDAVRDLVQANPMDAVE